MTSPTTTPNYAPCSEYMNERAVNAACGQPSHSCALKGCRFYDPDCVVAAVPVCECPARPIREAERAVLEAGEEYRQAQDALRDEGYCSPRYAAEAHAAAHLRVVTAHVRLLDACATLAALKEARG